jgi:phosphoglucosamine mutase
VDPKGSKFLFSMNKYFGTDGIRGSYGSEMMNEAFARKVGHAIGVFIKNDLQGIPTVVVASDTRPSGESLKQSLILGLREMDIQVLDFGVVPTPTLAFGILKHKATFGVMITASHNPFTDNGIKCFTANATKLEPEEELKLEDLIAQKHPVSNSGPEPISLAVDEMYLQHIWQHFSQLDLSGMPIALDCANGATKVTTPLLLEKLGAAVSCIHNGDGMINEKCGSEHMESLQNLVISEKAVIGIAHDGDGDRVRLVDRTGEVIDGDQILGLLALYAKREGKLRSSTFVSTIHSNQGLSSSLLKHDISLFTSDVGDRHVYLKMREKGSNWGGESSGHIICTDYLPTGDGLFAALSVLQTMQMQNSSIDRLAEEIQLWPSLSGSFAVSSKPPIEDIPELSEGFKYAVEQLGQDGRILLRYSGTEPKIRLLVEGKSLQLIEPHYKNLSQLIQKEL